MVEGNLVAAACYIPYTQGSEVLSRPQVVQDFFDPKQILVLQKIQPLNTTHTPAQVSNFSSHRSVDLAGLASLYQAKDGVISFENHIRNQVT